MSRASRLDERDVRVVTDVAAGCDGRSSARDEARLSRTAKPCGTSAADLKFLQRLPRVHDRNFKSKAALEF